MAEVLNVKVAARLQRADGTAPYPNFLRAVRRLRVLVGARHDPAWHDRPRSRSHPEGGAYRRRPESCTAIQPKHSAKPGERPSGESNLWKPAEPASMLVGRSDHIAP